MFREISKILGVYLFGFTLTLFLPLGVALYYQFWADPLDHPQSHTSGAFFATIFISALLSVLFVWIGRGAKGRLYRREGLAAVVFIWLLTPVLAALPFMLSGTLTNPVQAYFEATSGITTTGASVLTPKNFNEAGEEVPYSSVSKLTPRTEYVWYGNIDPVRDAEGRIIKEGIEAVSHAVLFWRSFLQWLGGLGIVVLFVAVLPALGVGGKMLFHSEMPGPVKEGLTPRIKETALVLWRIYLGLSFLEFAVLLGTNPDLRVFDAACITLSSISTGGFTVVNGSIGAYNSAATEWVLIFVMLAGSINFSLYYYSLRGKFYRFYDIELIVYLTIIIVSGIFITSYLVGAPDYLTTGGTDGIYSIPDAVRKGFFQYISAITGSGFAVADYDKWPFAVQSLMVISIYLGGMAGSTAGGIKIIRHIMLFRIVQDKIELLFRPETVRNFRIGERTVNIGAALTVLCFFVTVIAMAALGTFLLTLDGLDPESALAVITSTINNSGMGFREAGPTSSFAFLSEFGMILTSLWMIMGRLEFFTVLVVLVPSFWRES